MRIFFGIIVFLLALTGCANNESSQPDFSWEVRDIYKQGEYIRIAKYILHFRSAKQIKKSRIYFKLIDRNIVVEAVLFPGEK